MNYTEHNDLGRAMKDWHTGECRKVKHKLDGAIYEVWRIVFPKLDETYLDLFGESPGWNLFERVPVSQVVFLSKAES